MDTHLRCTIYLAIILAGVSGCEGRYAEDDWSVRELHRIWRQTYQKPAYRTEEEANERFQVFRENVKLINQLNDQYRGETEFILNDFADVSPTEFKRKILMPKRTPPTFEESRYIRGLQPGDLPASFDWTQKGAVTAVKNQGDVGSCWAFSAVENIEGQWLLGGHPLTNLSVEQVVECDSTQDQKTGNADCGVFGGWPYLAFQYIKRVGGIETWADYGYCAGLGGKPGTCMVCPAPGYNWTLCGDPVPYCNMSQSCGVKVDPSKFVKGLQVVDWKLIDQNETVIAQQLMSLGPMSVALDATELQFYHKGVFKPIFCSKTSLDHAVLMVGFGTEKDIFSTKPYWLIKNSWGAKWGESGFFRIYRGEGTCGINTQVTTAVLAKDTRIEVIIH